VSACEKKVPGAPSTAAPKKNSTVVAKVAGKNILEQEVDDQLEQLAQRRQRDYEGARGKARLIGQLVDRELMLKAAADQGLDRDPDITKQLESFKSGLVLQAYQRKLIDALPKPTDQQLQEYYDKHTTDFTTPARINASWIKCKTKADADKARHRVVERGEDFGNVARQMSKDSTTTPDGGLIGYFNPTG